MRLDINEDRVTLVLSERNLLALLTKLYTKGSFCTIQGPEGCPISVKSEHDDVHYGSRVFGPGLMHPITEKFIESIQEVVREHQ
jgi:hypothetical protein